MDYVVQEPVQGVTKLHCVQGGKWRGICIHVRVSVVGDGAGSTVTLRDNTQWAQAEVAEMKDLGGWQQGPVTLVHHVRKLFAKEGCMVFGGFVGSPTQGSALAVVRPG